MILNTVIEGVALVDFITGVAGALRRKFGGDDTLIAAPGGAA